MTAAATGGTGGTGGTGAPPSGGWRWRTRGAAAAAGVAAVATALGLLAALAGVWLTAPGVPPWPRFWATTYFVVLLWPVGLFLVGTVAGVRTQVAVAALLVLATAAQQVVRSSMPQATVQGWHATLAAPGDAVRQRIALPPAGDRAWQRAWAQATRVAVVVCTRGALPPAAELMVQINDRSPLALATQERLDDPQWPTWYRVPVTREMVDTSSRRLEVTVERRGRQSSDAEAAAICGGRDDPTRPGSGGAARRRNGEWSTERLADQPLPLVDGKPLLGRHYIELRFYDDVRRQLLGIYY